MFDRFYDEDARLRALLGPCPVVDRDGPSPGAADCDVAAWRRRNAASKAALAAWVASPVWGEIEANLRAYWRARATPRSAPAGAHAPLESTNPGVSTM